MIALTETWMNSDFSSSELFDETFVVYRNDRDPHRSNKTRGGGCLIALKNNVSSTRIPQWENEVSFENIWIAINQKKKKKIIHKSRIHSSKNFTRHIFAIF